MDIINMATIRMVNDAMVILANLKQTTALHVIDKVLLPQRRTTTKWSPIGA